MPEGDPRQVVYACSGTLSIAAAFWGLLRAGPAAPARLAAGGRRLPAWVIGDWIYLVEQSVFGVTRLPSRSRMRSTSRRTRVMAAGLVVIVRRRGSRGDLPALLDAAILATGTAVVVGVFVIAPITGDSTLTFLGKVTSSLYPIGDVLLLGILARLWTTPGARTSAFKLLAGGFALTLFARRALQLRRAEGRRRTTLVFLVNDLLWLGGYVLIAGAAWSPSVRDRRRPAPGSRGPLRPDQADGRPHRRSAAARVRPARRHPRRRRGVRAC